MSTGARISFGVYDEGAKEDASYSASSAQSWVNYSEIKNGLSPDETPEMFERYISGEPGVYRLDGSSRLFPSSTAGANLGYWSGVLSGSSGTFATSPVLSCAFSAPHTSVGITIHFDGTTHLTAFTVQWLYNGSVKSAIDVTGNNQQTVYVDNPVEDYTGLRIIPTSTDVPYRYVKIQEIDFGRRVVYDNSTLVSASVIEEADLSGGSAPANSLRVTVLDPNNRLNPVNPDGVYAYLRKGMPLTVEFLRDGTAYPGGVYYLDTWEGSNTGTAKLTAIDIIGKISGDSYASKFYASSDSATAGQLIDDFFAVCGASGSADTSIRAQSIQGYVPDISVQEALAHICLSCGGYVRTGRDGSLVISSPSQSGAGILLQSGDVLGEPTVSKTDTVPGTIIEVYSYTVETDGLYDTIPVYISPTRETYRHTFSGIGHNVVGRIESAMGGTWSEVPGRTGYNFATLEAWAEEDPGPLYIVVSGDKVTETSYSKGAASGSGQAVSVSGIHLITVVNADAVKSRLQSYYAKSLKIKLKTPWTAGLDCGARISVPTRFGSVTGHISRMDIDLTGGLIATVEVIA